jgi:hypothetical protein
MNAQRIAVIHNKDANMLKSHATVVRRALTLSVILKLDVITILIQHVMILIGALLILEIFLLAIAILRPLAATIMMHVPLTLVVLARDVPIQKLFVMTITPVLMILALRNLDASSLILVIHARLITNAIQITATLSSGVHST